MGGKDLEKWARWVGAVLFAGVGFFYLAAGLLAPLYGVAVLWLIYLGLVALLVHWWKPSPWLVLLVPCLAIGLWALVMYLGDVLLDWTA